MNPDLKVNLSGVDLKNPVLTASGTFGGGWELSDYADLNKLGGITFKGVSITPWTGNKPPRIAETYGGMLNSIGLQNPGVDAFIAEDYPYLKSLDTKIIINVCGHSVNEYVQVVEKLADIDIDLLELNVSCPNVSEGCISFGTDPNMVERIVKEVKAKAKQPLFVKLSPNVTDITEIARAAVSAGADGLSLINTLIGMKIDIWRRRTVLANKIGGLSGPCIKPVAVRMVNAVANVVDVPIIGMGGIMNGEDAIEFIMAGAAAVAVGTATLNDPRATVRIVSEIKQFMEENNINNLNEIKGIIK